MGDGMIYKEDGVIYKTFPLMLSTLHLYNCVFLNWSGKILFENEILYSISIEICFKSDLFNSLPLIQLIDNNGNK